MSSTVAIPVNPATVQQGKTQTAAMRRVRRRVKRLEKAERLRTGLQVKVEGATAQDFLRRARLADYNLQTHMPLEGLALNRLPAGISKVGMDWAMYVLDPASAPIPTGVPDYRTGGICTLPHNLDRVYACPNENWSTWCACFVTTSFPNMIGFVVATKDQADMDYLLSHKGFRKIMFQNISGEWWDCTHDVWDNETERAYYCCVYDNLLEVSSDGNDNFAAVQYRLIGRSITTSLSGPQMYYGGRIVSGQVEPSIMYKPPAREADTSQNHVAQIYLNVPIQTVDELIRVDPRRGQRDAILGDYNVLRLNVDKRYPTPFTSLYTGYFAICSEGATGLSEGDQIKYQSTYAPYEDNFQWGITYYLEMKKEVSVNYKMCSAVEIVPTPESVYSRTTHAAPMRDDYAMDFVQDATYILGHSYPSDYNDFRKLLGKIWGVARKIIPGAALIGSAFFPQAAPVLGTVAGILSRLGPKVKPKPSKAPGLAVVPVKS